MDRTQASGYVVNGAGHRVYADQVPGRVQGTSLVAADRTAVQEELVGGLIEASGQVPSPTNLAQIGTAVSILGNPPKWSQSVADAIGGYPLGFVVADPGSLGVWWQSSAAANMSVPGAQNASWQNLFAGLATQAALTAETQRATIIESNLQTNINQKLSLNGGNLTGPLSITAPSSGLTVNSTSNVNTGKNDATIYYSLTNRFGYAATSGLRENVGSSLVYMFAIYNGTEWYEFDLVAQGTNQGRIISPAGVGALTSDLTNFVTQAELTADLNNYVPASAIASGTIAGGTYTRIGNVLTQAFTVSVPSNGTNSHQITYPMEFSEAPSVSFVGDDTGNSRSFSLAPGTVPTATGFTMAVSGHGNSTYGDTNPVVLNVVAQGISS